MKKLIALLTVTALLSTLCACGGAKKKQKKESETYKPVNMSIACLKGPTGVGMASLMKKSQNNKTENNYTFTVTASADEITGKIVTGEINIASVPTNLAAKLYNKTGGKIKLLAVNTLGVLSIVENGNTIKNIKDLKGKTIYSIGEGSNPEFILRHILEENGLSDSVKIQFVASNDELTPLIVSGKAEVAMVSEPIATTVLTKKDSLRRVISINDEWKKITDNDLMMGCIVTLSSYAEKNKSQINKFLEEYESSINFANKSQKEAAEYCAEFEIIPSAQIAEKAIPNCNLVFKIGKQDKNGLESYYKVLSNYDKTALGGKLPNGDFYYEK